MVYPHGEMRVFMGSDTTPPQRQRARGHPNFGNPNIRTSGKHIEPNFTKVTNVGEGQIFTGCTTPQPRDGPLGGQIFCDPTTYDY